MTKQNWNPTTCPSATVISLHMYNSRENLTVCDEHDNE